MYLWCSEKFRHNIAWKYHINMLSVTAADITEQLNEYVTLHTDQATLDVSIVWVRNG